MELISVLASASDDIVEEATAAVGRSHLGHYDALGRAEVRRRVQALFDIVLECLRTRRLDTLVRYSEEVAEERFSAGYGIGELQTAFNVLEESMWRRVADGVGRDELAESLGLLSTVLGVGKDTLARVYVSLASHSHVASLDLRALFQGT